MKATLKALLAHKVRLILTVLAVVLGVGLMAGTFVLTDTIKGGIDNLFQEGVAGKAVVVQGQAEFSNSSAGGGALNDSNARPLVPESVIPKILSVPGVAAADGSVMGIVSVVNSNGKALAGNGFARQEGVAWLPDRSLSALSLRTGRGPESGTEVAIDAKTANDNNFHVGSSLTVTGNIGPQNYTVVGIFGYGAQDTVAGATIVAFDAAQAQKVAGQPGEFTEVDVSAKAGVNTAQLVTAVGAVLPAHYEAISAASAAAQSAASVDSFISSLNTFLLIFAFIALFVGAFLIFNTFSILIGQRTRELALMRAVGAGRGQIVGSVLTEAFLTGLFGAAVGLGFGILLAFGLTHVFKSALTLGSTTLQIKPRTILASLGAGSLITLASAILPAARASRVPPVVAMRDDPMLAETSLKQRVIIGCCVTLVGAVLLGSGLIGGGSTLSVGVGALILVIGIAMLVPLIASPLARTIGAPLPIIEGVTGRLAKENAARNPRRTAATASALMIGIAVVGVIATLASSALASFDGIFDKSIQASYGITSKAGADFAAGPAEAAVRTVGGITAFSGISDLAWHDKGAAEEVTGIDPTDGPKVFIINMANGSTAALSQGELLIDQTTATSSHLHVGSTVAMTFAITGTKDLTVGGIYQDNQFLGSYVLSNAVVAANSNALRDNTILLKTTSITPAEENAIVKALADFPNMQVQTGAQFKAAGEKSVDGALKVVYVLLALTIVIALFGVVNTLALSVLERTREIGLLRAIGMYRRQVRGMILGEAVVVSVLGAVLGLALGVGLGAALVSVVATGGGSFVTVFVVPVKTIIVVLVVAAIAGLLAGLFPAHRAARLDVLKAVSTV